eukprot:208519-Rhodomonas_salina.1
MSPLMDAMSPLMDATPQQFASMSKVLSNTVALTPASRLALPSASTSSANCAFCTLLSTASPTTFFIALTAIYW